MFLMFLFERERESVNVCVCVCVCAHPRVWGGAEREGDTESEAGSRL